MTDQANPSTPEEFARQMRALANNRSGANGEYDNEWAYDYGVEFMCVMLERLGYGEGTEIFREIAAANRSRNDR